MITGNCCFYTCEAATEVTDFLLRLSGGPRQNGQPAPCRHGHCPPCSLTPPIPGSIMPVDVLKAFSFGHGIVDGQEADGEQYWLPHRSETRRTA